MNNAQLQAVIAYCQSRIDDITTHPLESTLDNSKIYELRLVILVCQNLELQDGLIRAALFKECAA